MYSFTSSGSITELVDSVLCNRASTGAASAAKLSGCAALCPVGLPPCALPCDVLTGTVSPCTLALRPPPPPSCEAFAVLLKVFCRPSTPLSMAGAVCRAALASTAATRFLYSSCFARMGQSCAAVSGTSSHAPASAGTVPAALVRCRSRSSHLRRCDTFRAAGCVLSALCNACDCTCREQSLTAGTRASTIASAHPACPMNRRCAPQ